MIRLIQDKRDAIEALCRIDDVARLEVFGSAAEGAFDSQQSDVDFLIEYLPATNLGSWMSHYFDLNAELERLLGHNIDFVMPCAMRNPSFIHEVNRTRQVVYAA